MAGKSSAAETPVAPEATTPVETPVTTPAGDAAQENSAIDVEAIKRQAAEAQAAVEKITKERNDAIANALRADAQYKGLQNQTTKTLQRAAEDRRALLAAQAQAAEIGDIKQLLNTVISKVLDEDSAKEFTFTQRDLELKRREAAFEAAKNAPVEEPVAEPQQYNTPENEKAQFLSYYFPGVELDPNDPSIDWGLGANSTPEAFSRLTASVMKIKDKQDQAKTNDAIAAVQAESAKQLEAVKQQIADLAAKSQQDIETAKTTAADEARKEAEKRLRAMGADVSGGAPSDGARRTLNQALNEQIPDDLAYKDPKEYSRRVEAMKQQVRESFKQ